MTAHDFGAGPGARYRVVVPSPILQRLRAAFDAVFHEIAKFGAVGAVNFVIDAGIFNLLLLTKFGHKPVTAGTISTSVAIISSYFMNRHWTWRHKQRAHPIRELALFIAISAVGLVISLACLGVSRYVFGFTTLWADNIAKNGFGLLFGMVWRFWAFKKWIFLPVEADSAAGADAADLAVRTTI